jgi:hypothetical protein
MNRGSWIYDRERDAMVPRNEYYARKEMVRAVTRSSLPSPPVIGAMAPIQSMADGQWYDDKRSYQKSLARAGCEVVGFDKDWEGHVQKRAAEIADNTSSMSDIVADVKKAIEIESSK